MRSLLRTSLRRYLKGSSASGSTTRAAALSGPSRSSVFDVAVPLSILRFLACSAVVGVLAFTTALAQPYGACPTNDPTCPVKYAAYDGYLTQMGAGVTMHSLPALYQDVLAPYFPEANLSEVSFGFSNRQPPNNATCDCDKIYFNDATQVEQMRTGALTSGSRIHWMLHELRHFEQCREVGGRPQFARLWWEHLSATELTTLISTNAWNEVHDQMQMEEDADTRADNVWNALQSCCIQPSTGLLVRPLNVTSMEFSDTAPTLNEGLTVEVEASDGAEPYDFEWSWRRPSSGIFQPVTATSVSPSRSRVVLALTQLGANEVRVRVQQGGGSANMQVHEETRSFVVHGPEVAGLHLDRASIAGGASTQATVSAQNLPSGQPTTVHLTSSNAAATVPDNVSLTAGGDGMASATFTIETGMYPSTRTATIEARIGNSARQSTLTIQGAEPIPAARLTLIEPDLRDLLPDAPFTLRLRLDRPAPEPLDVLLESSDSRAVAVPRQVRFEKGEQEKSISLRTARSPERMSSVKLRARLDSDRAKPVETAVRVRPPAPTSRDRSERRRR